MDDLDWLPAADFVFRVPLREKKDHRHEGRKRAAGAGRRDALAKLACVARRSPEVMVKVSGSARGAKGLKQHLAYITRNGALVAEREGGELVVGRDGVASLAEDWWADAQRGRGMRARDTINLVLSMPPGIDRTAVAEAASAFAREVFGGQYDYLMAVHEDTDHPHAHVTVKTRGYAGQRLNPKKADLQAWREAFAKQLQERGVDAAATPRAARGVVRKGQKQAIRHLDARRASRVTLWKLQQAVKAAGAAGAPEGSGDAGPWVAAIAERQRKVRLAWATIGRALESEGHVAMAIEVKQFLAGMPPVETERERMLLQARKMIEMRQAQQGGKDRVR